MLHSKVTSHCEFHNTKNKHFTTFLSICFWTLTFVLSTLSLFSLFLSFSLLSFSLSLFLSFSLSLFLSFLSSLSLLSYSLTLLLSYSLSLFLSFSLSLFLSLSLSFSLFLSLSLLLSFSPYLFHLARAHFSFGILFVSPLVCQTAISLFPRERERGFGSCRVSSDRGLCVVLKGAGIHCQPRKRSSSSSSSHGKYIHWQRKGWSDHSHCATLRGLVVTSRLNTFTGCEPVPTWYLSSLYRGQPELKWTSCRRSGTTPSPLRVAMILDALGATQLIPASVGQLLTWRRTSC